MRRRDFLGILGGAAATWPLGTQAERTEQIRRIGVLMAFAANDPEAVARVKAFESAWPGLGWARGRNIEVDYRWASNDPDRLRLHAAELVASNPRVILTVGTPVMRAVRAATQSIPIVFVGVSDPDGTKIVTSMARPGGNMTGFANFEPSIGGKWLQALKEISPNLATVGVLHIPATQQNFLQAIKAMAGSLGITPFECPGRSAVEVEQTMNKLNAQSAAGLIVLPDPAFVIQRELIVSLAAKHRMPAVYPFRAFVYAGGLMTYGVDPIDQLRQAATYVDRIIKGARPGDLPVQAPTKFDVLNLKTARELGLDVPPTLLARADEVIE